MFIYHKTNTFDAVAAAVRSVSVYRYFVLLSYYCQQLPLWPAVLPVASSLPGNADMLAS
jgi:hypothetical protein